MSGSLPAFDKITADNQGPAVVVSACILIVVNIFFVSIRVGSTFKLKRTFGIDDGLLVMAVVRSNLQRRHCVANR
jgi:hypothetical protein